MQDPAGRDAPWPEADLVRPVRSAPALAAGADDAPLLGAGAGGDADDPLGELGRRLRDEVARLDQELAEVSLLAQQAAAEAERHAARTAQSEERAQAVRRGRAEVAEVTEADDQLLGLLKRGAMLDSQVEVLEAKRASIARQREAIAAHHATIAALAALGVAGGAAPAGTTLAVPLTDEEAAEAQARATEVVGTTRLVLGAQEDLRREIARAMHDGPAQSLTNIVLEAQIVERLLERDPAAAKAEMHRLTAMVQSTLDATKRFIFDVRPMVLDDLGLVPTLRRAARDRGRASGTTIAFDTLGPDQRLAPEVESAIFRMVDEAIAAFLEGRPARLFVRLDWGDALDVRVGAVAAEKAPAPERSELPPALAALLEERGGGPTRARDAFPDPILAEIRSLAATIDAEAVLLEDGLVMRLVVPLPAAG